MKLLSILISLVALGSLPTLSSCQKNEAGATADAGQQDALELKFGIYTADKPSAVVAQFRPVLDQLELAVGKQLNRRVHIKLNIAATYEKGIESITSGKVDFARLGPASYVLAKQKNDAISIIATESNKGEKIFHGVIVVHQQSNINFIKDLKDKTFAFGSEKSTIGRYLSQQELMQNGILASDLKSYEYLGRHDAVGAAVGARRFDAGALKVSTYQKLLAKGVPIRVLVRFPNVTKPWVTLEQADPRVVAAIKAALLTMKDADALKALGKQGFLEGADADYAIIRDSMEKNDGFFGR